MKNTKIAILFFVMATTFSALGNEKNRPYRSDKKSPMAEMTAEQRETMAARHEKLAGCLRSGKPMAECHEEMMGVEDCRMMGKMHSRGMMDGSEKKRDK